MRRPHLICPNPPCQQGRNRVSYLKGREKPDFMKNAIALCESCGTYIDGKGVWKSVCAVCKKEVDIGGLRGLFVPHLCPTCLGVLIEKQKKEGKVCSLCKQPYCLCCC